MISSYVEIKVGGVETGKRQLCLNLLYKKVTSSTFCFIVCSTKMNRSNVFYNFALGCDPSISTTGNGEQLMLLTQFSLSCTSLLCSFMYSVIPYTNHCNIFTECSDQNSLCPEWAHLGECTRSAYMHTDCRESCQLCKNVKRRGKYPFLTS